MTVGYCGHVIERARLKKEIDTFKTDHSSIIVRIEEWATDDNGIMPPDTFNLCADCIGASRDYQVHVNVFVPDKDCVHSNVTRLKEDKFFQEVSQSPKIKRVFQEQDVILKMKKKR